MNVQLLTVTDEVPVNTPVLKNVQPENVPDETVLVIAPLPQSKNPLSVLSTETKVRPLKLKVV